MTKITYRSPVNMKLRSLLLGVVVVFLMTLNSSLVSAHPHNWIDLKSSFVVDENIRITQIKQHWKFDIYYSSITLADAMNEYKDEKKGLNMAAQEIIKNLAAYNYFSSLRVNGSAVPLPAPSEYKLYVSTEEGMQNLEMDMVFNMPFEIAIDKQTVEWQVFDPTFYIAMMYSESSNIEVISNYAVDCSASVEQANPSEEIINYAMSLDQSQRKTDGLGKHFAENIRINCYQKY